MLKRYFCLLFVVALAAASHPAQSRFDYPKPRRADQVDEFHGTKVADPYRWMEQTDAPETRAWIDAQNTLTNTYLATIPQRDAIKKRLTELWNYERYSAPQKLPTAFIFLQKMMGCRTSLFGIAQNR